jgi:hypothetical protein
VSKTSKPHIDPSDAGTVRYYLNIVAEEDAHAEAIAALDRLLEQFEVLAEALSFYADERTYTQPTSWGGRIIDQDGPWLSDTGRLAREALVAAGVATPSTQSEGGSEGNGERGAATGSFPAKSPEA